MRLSLAKCMCVKGLDHSEQHCEDRQDDQKRRSGKLEGVKAFEGEIGSHGGS